MESEGVLASDNFQSNEINHFSLLVLFPVQWTIYFDPSLQAYEELLPLYYSLPCFPFLLIYDCLSMPEI